MDFEVYQMRNMKKIFRSLIIMLIAISTVSVTAEYTSTYYTPSLSQLTTGVNITIQDFFFSPDNITIPVDTIVTWTNLGPLHHTATSDNGVFNSGLLAVGQKFSFTFTEAGTYKYHCAPHPFMHGTIIVTGGGDLPPSKPIITGSSTGIPGEIYTYTAVATDPEGMTISYFFDWGDNTNSGWTPFVTSGTTVNASHNWSTKGSYTITVKAKDEHGGISPSATLEISMPHNYQLMSSILKILNRFHNKFPSFVSLILRE